MVDGSKTRSGDTSNQEYDATWRVASVATLAKCSRSMQAHLTLLTAVHNMSHGLLLRLFLSPSFFSVDVALRYLMIYSDNIGITYYLTRRLREFTIEELSDVWGFVWCVPPQNMSMVSVSLTIRTVTFLFLGRPSREHSNVL